MKVISFISRKGGTGKTTNAIHLATCLFSLGHQVILIETDTNYTLNTLRQMEVFKAKKAVGNVFSILSSTDEKVILDLERINKEKFSGYVIVDSAGKTTNADIKKLCMASDLVIVPTSLSQNDLLVTYQTIEDLKPAKEIHPHLKIAVLPNRLFKSTKIASVKSQLSNLDAHILEHFVPMKNTFVQFSTIRPEREYFEVSEEIVSLIN
jgi:chromosome partitioning protein